MSKIVANYKVNFVDADFKKLLKMIDNFSFKNAEFIVCPPYTSLHIFKNKSVLLGAQNLSSTDKIPTGEISAEMLRDMNVKYVILGHSERRKAFFETDEQIRNKVLKALEFGLKPIVCVGESLQNKKKGETLTVLEKQLNTILRDIYTNELENIIIAYEPIWAIGSGNAIKKSDLQEIVKSIKSILEKMYGKLFVNKISILYGGSVNVDNYQSIMSVKGIDGLLVGGVALDFEKLFKIIEGLN